MATISQKQIGDFKNSVLLLKSHLDSYESGNSLMYLPMAVELRKLLCEKQGEPLINLAIPGVELYKLHSTELFGNNPNLLVGLMNFMPGRLSPNGKSVIFTLSISSKREKIGLEAWLDQMFFKEGICIREFIKSIAEKEAAHADKNDNSTLLHCKSWKFNDVGCHTLGIYGIARFIYDFVSSEHPEII